MMMMSSTTGPNAAPPGDVPIRHVSLTVYAFVVAAFEAALGAPRRANRRAVGSATDRCVAPRELGSAAEISVET